MVTNKSNCNNQSTVPFLGIEQAIADLVTVCAFYIVTADTTVSSHQVDTVILISQDPYFVNT